MQRTKCVLSFVVVAALSAGGCGASGEGTRNNLEYCAIMPDSIGLYEGNPVTQMGFPIGRVRKLTPSALNVKVDFSIVDRKLPADVKAVTRSPSILADRALELVGNYESGPALEAGHCIALPNSTTPKSLSETIGSASEFVKTLSDKNSTNIQDSIRGLDAMSRDKGNSINALLTRTSSLLDSPDQSISQIGLIIENTVTITGVIKELRGPIRQVIDDAQVTTLNVANALVWAADFAYPVATGLTTMLADIEATLGDTLQLTLDTVGVSIRKVTSHSNAIAHLLDLVPWWINAFVNHANKHEFAFLSYRPVMYRIRTNDGLALCGMLNSASPGSCADIGGMPYAVDVNLLQYVFAEAARQ